MMKRHKNEGNKSRTGHYVEKYKRRLEILTNVINIEFDIMSNGKNVDWK
jgi:hypothetical protein